MTGKRKGDQNIYPSDYNLNIPKYKFLTNSTRSLELKVTLLTTVG